MYMQKIVCQIPGNAIKGSRNCQTIDSYPKEMLHCRLATLRALGLGLLGRGRLSRKGRALRLSVSWDVAKR